MPAGSEGRLVLALVTNPATHDTRVIKEAESLVSAGFRVVVLAEKTEALPDREERNGVTYRRIGLPWLDVFWTILRKGMTGTAVFGPVYRVAALFILPFVPLLALRSAAGVVRRRGSASADTSTSGRRVPSARKGLTGLAMRIAARVYNHYLMSLVSPVVHCERYIQCASSAIADTAPSAIHAHDVDTLPAAVLAGRQMGIPVVYDAHELETDRADRRGWAVRLLTGMLERRALSHVARTITVSEGIAQHMARAYGITAPVVVLNSPSMHAFGRSERDVRDSIGLPAGVPLAVYVGLVTFARGIPEVIRALQHAPAFHLALIGPRQESIASEFKALAASLGVGARVHFVDPVPPRAVPSFVASADAGLVTLPAISLSYEYALPNKLFEIGLAGVPLVVARLQSMKRFVEQNGIGLAVDSADPHAIARALREVLENRKRYVLDDSRLAGLRARYAWESQQASLLSVYDGLWLGRRAVEPT